MTKSVDLGELSEEELLAEVARRRVERHGSADTYTFEVDLEERERESGGMSMQAFFDKYSEGETVEAKPCPKCGKLCRVNKKQVKRKVRSRHGVHELRRHYHRCGECKGGFYPLDTELNLPSEGELTARLEQLVLDLGLHSPFAEGAERYSLHHGTPISENLIRRVVERVGKRAQARDDLAERARAPSVTAPSTLLVQVDGSMLPTRGADPWREVKVGLVVREDRLVDNKGRGLITEARFVARLGDFTGFKEELMTALNLERAWECERLVVVGDGAKWVWSLADEICPGAIQILDYPHALQYAHNAAKALFEAFPGLQNLFVEHIERELWAGRVGALIQELQSCLFAARGKPRKALMTLIRYYSSNKGRMRYDLYAQDGLPVGSGAIESAHRHLLQKRMKLAGQHWEPHRADRLARLRALLATAGPNRIYPVICAEAA